MEELIVFIRQWGQLCLLSLLAAATQMYMSGTRITFFHYFMSVLMAILSAYIADSFCRWLGLDEGLKTGIIGIAAYVAPHILTGVNALAKAVSKDPKHFLDIIMRNKS
ncbi:hypothetical protein AKG98_3638 [Moritella sp. JT01]|uniref:hypothetical protein n=1 Tax=Moritella sp. JT01 TaxID=756698 RepID=UPI00079C0DBD|nr:hypothetical protein [Moritella sp. JT01]KXO12445.1 hypothetical protein AKG98_3638 [Moritella sp. JT01]